MGSCVVGMVQWFKPAARSMRDGQDYADFFAFSIFQILFFMSVQRLWGNLLAVDRPAGLPGLFAGHRHHHDHGGVFRLPDDPGARTRKAAACRGRTSPGRSSP
jgi:hypothetical protein